MSANIPASGVTHRAYSFGEFTLDLDRGALLTGGADVALRPKSFEVLSYLVERQGLLVTKDELLDAIWGQAIVSEDAVTQCLRDIRKAIRDPSQKKIRTVPRRGYIFDVPVTKNGGLVTASDEDSRSRFASGWPGWRLVVAIVLMLGVAALWWAFGIRGVKVPTTVEPQSVVAPHSIAVMPFLDMSPKQDHAYFADGISEEILNLLAQVSGLRVIARTSSFSFKGQNVDIATIAKQLNVTHVLEGSVRKDRDRIRITAQLVNASSSDHLWSQVYDRELESIFAVQDEISAAIVAALKDRLGLQLEAVPRVIAPANTEAYDAYLRGRYLVVQRTWATIESATLEFEEALTLDPDFALAHAELAIASMFLTRYGDLTVTEATAKATPHVERALAIDPNLAEAHAAAGYVLRFRGHAEEALTHFTQALWFNPNYAIVYNVMGVLFEELLGRHSDALVAFETAARLDPLSLPPIGNRVVALHERNRLAEAEPEAEKLAAIAPGMYARIRGDVMSTGGKWADLIPARLDALRIDPEQTPTRRNLSSEFAAIGLGKEALAISEGPNPRALSWLGKHEDAVRAAEARLTEDPLSLIAHRDLALALADAGDFVRARPILEEMWQKSGERISRDGAFPANAAAASIVIWREAGDEAAVSEFVAALKDNARRAREAGIVKNSLYFSADYEEGLADYFAGERERGLALIARAAEDGFFIPPNAAYLKVLFDDPGFGPILASQEARQVREREKFLAIVCSDNPYAAVWQPAEETCEQFAAAGEN
jgi:TolB-like protein/DNA-binding winged helix-turn-helix (wHTH) protein